MKRITRANLSLATAGFLLLSTIVSGVWSKLPPAIFPDRLELSIFRKELKRK